MKDVQDANRLAVNQYHIRNTPTCWLRVYLYAMRKHLTRRNGLTYTTVSSTALAHLIKRISSSCWQHCLHYHLFSSDHIQKLFIYIHDLHSSTQQNNRRKSIENANELIIHLSDYPLKLFRTLLITTADSISVPLDSWGAPAPLLEVLLYSSLNALVMKINKSYGDYNRFDSRLARQAFAVSKRAFKARAFVAISLTLSENDSLAVPLQPLLLLLVGFFVEKTPKST